MPNETTQLSDVFNRDVLASYMVESSLDKNAFVQSGVIAQTPVLNQLAVGLSNEITIPYWKKLDASLEPNYSNDNPDDVAETRKVGTGTMKGRVAYLNEGFSSADLVTEITGESPLKYVANVIDGFWNTQVQQRLIASSLGIYNDNVANNGGDMVVNIAAAETGGVGAATKWSADAFIDADATMGDKLTELGAIAVHRMVYSQMQKENLIEFVEDSNGVTNIPIYQGKRVIVDNALPIIQTGTAKQYVSILYGAGAFGGGIFTPRNDLMFERTEAQANGGGVEQLWTRRNMIIHPGGYNFTSASITGNTTEDPAVSASWADLSNAANWERKFDREAVKLAYLVTN